MLCPPYGLPAWASAEGVWQPTIAGASWIERVVRERLDHEQGEVHPARHVALQDRIPHVPAPHRQALALALLQVAPRTTVHRVSLAKIRRHAST